MKKICEYKLKRNLKMYKKILHKIEGKRNSDYVFWRTLVLLKDIAWNLVESCPISLQEIKLKIRKLKHKKIIKDLVFQVCSSCQNNCRFCSHKGLILKYKNYHLSIKELKKFIYYTKKSGYYIGRLRINGPGEPTLWKHFNEGIKLLRNSGVVDKILITTDGLSLDRIDDKSWKCINLLEVSAYPSFNKWDLLKLKQKKYKNKIKIKHIKEFRAALKKHHKGVIPCKCICGGPMFIKDKIFFYCGPTLFSAADFIGADPFDYPELYSNIGLNYMERFNGKNIGNLEFCKHCWANSNIKLDLYPHSVDER